jgi:LPS sulfotransferase NodH
MFGDLRIEPLEFWYEDAIATPEEAVRQVAEYLGVDLRSDAVVAVPTITKQAESDSGEWRQRYAQRAP